MVLVTQKKKQPPVHEKRRYGHHHKQTKKYHHTYWPYLPLALIITLGIAVSNFWPTLQSAILGYATNTTINGLLLETNNERAAAGVGNLSLNSQLNAAAQAKAEDMASRGYWAHNTPEGNPPWTFIQQSGYAYTAAGENLAYGFDSSGATVAGWMGSPPHKQNLLASGYVHAGFGIANAENYQSNGPQTIVVAMYGTPVAFAEAPAPAEPATEPTPAPEPQTQPAETPAPTEVAQEAQAKTEEPEQPSQPPVQAESKPPETQQVARLELLSGQTAGWAVMAATLIAATAAVVFIFRHSIFWHRALVKGERFIIKHHFLDIVLVTLAVVALILIQTAGQIY